MSARTIAAVTQPELIEVKVKVKLLSIIVALFSFLYPANGATLLRHKTLIEKLLMFSGPKQDEPAETDIQSKLCALAGCDGAGVRKSLSKLDNFQ